MRRMLIDLRFASVFALLSLVLFCMPSAAFADNAYSPWVSATVYGIRYQHQSGVYADSSHASSSAHCKAQQYLPAGYIGVYPRLYNSSGVLLKYSNWTYSPANVGGIGISTDDYYGTGTFYGQGRVSMYNGNGYSIYTTNRTPNVQSRGAVPELSSPMFTTDDGLTFGSALFCDHEELDFVFAKGSSGKIGFVKTSDMEGDIPTSPAEALMQNNQAGPSQVPLYDMDGETVIDYFTVDNGNVVYYEPFGN